MIRPPNGVDCSFCGGELDGSLEGGGCCPKCGDEHSIRVEFADFFIHLLYDDVWVRLNFKDTTSPRSSKNNTTDISVGYEENGHGMGEVIATLEGYPITPANIKSRIEKLRSFI